MTCGQVMPTRTFETLLKAGVAAFGVEEALQGKTRVCERILKDFAPAFGDTTHLALEQKERKITALIRSGAYPKALDEAESLEKEARETAGTKSKVYAESLSLLGIAYSALGRNREAIAPAQQAIPLFEALHGGDHSAFARALHNLAEYLFREDRTQEAIPLFKRALEVHEKSSDSSPISIAETSIGLANSLATLKRYSEAKPYYERSLKLFQKDAVKNSDIAFAHFNLGAMALENGDLTTAEDQYTTALAVYDEAGASEHPNAAMVLGGLAKLLADQGRFSDAEKSLQRAYEIYKKSGLAYTQQDLAQVYLRQGKYLHALPIILGVTIHGTARLNVALPVLKFAYPESLLPAAAAMDFSLNVVQRASQSSAAAAVSQLAVRLAAGKSRLSLLVRKDQDLVGEATILDKSLIAAVSRETRQRDVTAEQRIRDRIASIAKERADLQQVFARDFPDYAALSNPLPLTVKDIQGQLSSDEALVAFALAGNKESYVFSITRDHADWHAIRLGDEVLTQKVAEFRKGLDVDELNRAIRASTKPDLFDLSLAHELYTALLGPIETMMKDKKHIMIVPSGALTALPFHLLVTQKPAAAKPDDLAGYRDASWLLKRHAVTVLPSVASLKSLRAHPHSAQSKKPMIGFADPIFDPVAAAPRRAAGRVRPKKSTTRSFSDFWKGAEVDRERIAESLLRLPETVDELKSVAKALGASAKELHFGNQATETRVKKMKLDDYRIVYFATHGLVAGDIKGVAEPSLALTIPKRPTSLDDGLLTASEVAELKLNADWVVLSACNTIAGDKPGAEALSGLARAFFYAGTRALLVSHWAADSAAATRLTTATFDKIKANPKVGRSEALRQTMLDMINDDTDPRNAYPAYWAPFVVVGEGGSPSAVHKRP